MAAILQNICYPLIPVFISQSVPTSGKNLVLSPLIFYSNIVPADVWIYYGVSFGAAEIFRGNGRMACSPACGVFHAYADGISDQQNCE